MGMRAGSGREGWSCHSLAVTRSLGQGMELVKSWRSPGKGGALGAAPHQHHRSAQFITKS